MVRSFSYFTSRDFVIICDILLQHLFHYSTTGLPDTFILAVTNSDFVRSEFFPVKHHDLKYR